MKIGLVCPYDIFRGGGVQEHVLAQAAELRSRGHQVIIVTPKPRKHGPSHPDNIIFVGNSTNLKTMKTSLELGISLGRDALDELLSAEKFDLLHIHEPEVPVLGAQIVAKADCPVIATFHAVQPDTPMARTLEALRIPYSRSIFTRIAAMTAVSDTAAIFVRERTRQPVEIIPNGINLDKYSASPPKRRNKVKTILYVGRLEARKGLKYLLRAFALLPQENLRLIIAGDGRERKKLQDLADDYNLQNVSFLGYVDEQEKLKLLSRADLFCSPAIYGESFGIVLLEAMACGLVSVVGNNAGYVSIMQGRGAISVVNPKDAEEFARRISLLLYDDGLRALWRDWALECVKRYDYKKVVNAYERLYKKTLQNL